MTDQTEASAPPALFDHCVNTYRAMLARAKTVVSAPIMSPDLNDLEAEAAETLLSDDPTVGSIVVYEGFFTALLRDELHLSVPYYTSVRRKLIEMGCARQLKRGGGNSPSQWELICEPTLELFTASEAQKKTAKGKDTLAMVQDQVLQLIRRVSVLEQSVEAIQDALAEQFGTTSATEE